MSEHKPHPDHEHQHGETCGHRAVRHGGHTDYEHDGHRHTMHRGHADECRIESGKESSEERRS